jgi:hypothetical protein
MTDRCFVVQGFGKKTDFTDGRVLDLNASYAVIKEAVEAAGLDGTGVVASGAARIHGAARAGATTRIGGPTYLGS